MNKLLALVVLAACNDVPLTPPASTPPPPWGVPISGGNLLVTHGGATAVIADTDRDRIVEVDLASGGATELALQPGDEPGRLVEDAAGRVHVALRRGGALVTVADHQISARRTVCAEPRGVAYDAAADAIVVACATGELVTLPAAGGEATRTLRLDRDLRDVIVGANGLVVTRFRSAELLALDATGAVTQRVTPPTLQRASNELDGTGSAGTVPAVPEVAWRTIALGDGRLVMAHQRQVDTVLRVTQGGYGGQCGGGAVESSIALWDPASPAGTPPLALASVLQGALPVDVAVSPVDGRLAFALAGAGELHVVPSTLLSTTDAGPCSGGGEDHVIDDQLGAPTSIAFTPDGTLLAYYPELPALVVHGASSRTIKLPGAFGYDAGRALFHTQTSVGLACASCHPEGRDDGRVWQFSNTGPRRTQSLAGGILERAPYHWSGDMTDLPALMDDVFAVRMAGGTPTHSQHASLGPWLERLAPPASAPPVDVAAVARGKALFESADVGCTTCHAGPLYTTRALVDVGTGGTFKVPSLAGVGARPPFLHDGCAATLHDRFTTCGGADMHGKTSQLSAQQVDDLVAFLESL